MSFKKSLKHMIKDAKQVIVLFNHPSQLVRPRSGPETIWDEKENAHMKIEMFQISSVELLKRRNKSRNKCTVDWNGYDDLVLKHHIRKIGCRAPYISKYSEFPICNAKDRIRKAYFDGWQLDKLYMDEPCQEMTNIDFKHTFKTFGPNATKYGRYRMYVAFPMKGKIVTQLQEVDAHALIGNIGGYIGLFLGKTNIFVASLTIMWGYQGKNISKS